MRRKMETSDLLMLLARVASALGDRGVSDYEIPAERLEDLLDSPAGPAGEDRAAQVAAVAAAVGGEVS